MLANLSILTVMTMGSSWVGSIATKSSLVKSIGGILDRPLIMVECTY